MVMEQRRSLFGRLFDRLWRNQDYSRGSGLGRSVSSLEAATTPFRYSQRVRDTVREQFLLQTCASTNVIRSEEREFDSPPLQRPRVVSGVGGIGRDFGLRFAARSEYYVPKCLAEVDCHALLNGQTTYDDFSESCWLEDHLHRFGDVQNSDSNSSGDADSSRTDSESSISIPTYQPANPNPTFTPQWHSILDNFQLAVMTSDLPPEAPPPAANDFALPSSGSPSPQAEVYRGNPTSTVSSGSRSTVSDITQFYNSMGVLGSLPLADDRLEPPPPYSELPEDPPPPYTFASQVPERQSERRVRSIPSPRAITRDAILW